MDHRPPGDFPVPELNLRLAGPADRAFLLSLSPGPLPQLQIEARERQYRQGFPGCELWIVQAGGVAAGQLWIWRTLHQTRILDLTLRPEYRNRGLGTALLRRIMREGRRVTLSVAASNTGAQSLYRRLGFRVTHQGETHWRMEADPDAPGGFSGQ